MAINIHLKALKCLEKMRDQFENQFIWINEALVVAKETFASPEIHMIPKTPSASRSRRIIQQVMCDDNDDFDEQPPKKMRNAKHPRKNTKVSSQEDSSAAESDSVETSSNTASRSSRARTTRANVCSTSGDTEQENDASASSARSSRARIAKKPAGSSTRSTRNTKKHRESEDNKTAPQMSMKQIIDKSNQDSPLPTDLKDHVKTVTVDTKMDTSNADEEINVESGPEEFSIVVVPDTEDESDSHSDDAVDNKPSEAITESPQAMDTSSPVSSTKPETPTVQQQQKPETPIVQQQQKPETPTLQQQQKPANSPHVTAACPSPNTPLDKSGGSVLTNVPKINGLSLNVKDKATKYEEMVRNSLGSRSSSPRVTPKLCEKVASKINSLTPKSSPLLNTPPTVVSKAKIVLKDHSPSPKVTVESMQVSCSNMDNSSDSEKSSRSSRKVRVSGSKLSLSRRRSSIQRHVDRSSVGQPKLTHLEQIKARLLNASMNSMNSNNSRPGSSPTPVRSTRSKMRAAVAAANAKHTAKKQQKKNTPEPAERSTRSKLRLNKTTPHEAAEEMETPPRRTTRSKLRVKPEPPTLPISSDSDDGTPCGTHLKVAPPSNLAPTRSTRSKMRHLQEQDGSSNSPCFGGNRLDTIKKAEMAIPSPVRAKRAFPEDRHNHTADIVCGTPDRMQHPIHAQSFLNQLSKKPRMTTGTPGNLNATVTSFLQRNTPTRKPTTKEILEHKRKQLLMKDKQDDDRLQKRHEYMQKKAEEQKKKREERQLLVAKRREDQLRKEKEMKKEISQKLEEKKHVTAKLQEERNKEDKEKQKLREKKMMEAEMRRKQEEEARQQRLQEMEQEQQRLQELQQRKKDFEDSERARRIAEQHRLQEERAIEAARVRLQEKEKLRQLDEQKLREEQTRHRDQQERDRREKGDRDRHDFERQKEREMQKQQELDKQREQERHRVKEEKAKLEDKRLAQEEEKRLQRMIEKHNMAVQQQGQNTSVSAAGSKQPVKDPNQPAAQNKVDKENTDLNSTFTKDQKNSQEEECQSYDMTPVRKVYKKASEENYNISDLRSDDSTDDEEDPRKKIPAWASGAQFRAHLINQYYKPPDLDQIFDIIDVPDLAKIFHKVRPRFFKRTSSAVWRTPIFMPSGKPVEEDHS